MCVLQLFPKLWRHKLWNESYIFDEAVFLRDKEVKKKCKNIEDKKSF